MKFISYTTTVLALLFFGGCATIMHGTKQDISIASDPPGAKAIINNISVTTPSTIPLQRKHTYRVEISKPGYESKTARVDKNFSAWYLVNIPFISVAGGLIGLIIDAVNGAMWNLDPDEVRVHLEPAGGGAAAKPGPERTIKKDSPGTYSPPDITVPPYQGDKSYAAVMDLECKVGISDELASLLSEKMRTSVYDTGLFRVVDRKNMEAILSEQGFQLSDCTSSECAVQVGRLMGVNKIILGSIGKIEEKSIITVQVVNVETGEIESVAGEECFCRMTDLTAAVETAVKRMAVKIIEGPR